ncbi:MAG TPA: hypothetical protein VMX97_14060 [Hyphomicrobiaceae bacterium]|nr:hypothetical protein [Hyphomicrobiaceae bacterium]
MTVLLSDWGRDHATGRSIVGSEWACKAMAGCGVAAALTFAFTSLLPASVEMSEAPHASALAQTKTNGGTAAGARRPERTFGGYGGVAYTHPTTVTINGSKTADLTVKNFDWLGRPFKAPVYYGLRTQRWAPDSPFGAMVDFTHAKAIAKPDGTASFSGNLAGKPLPKTAAIKDIFKHLEFSHGHNILTLNALLRLAPSWARIRPYVGAGAGASFPHTEIGMHALGKRTYEYQFAGFAGQALAGLEIQLGRASIFIEYKFTYAPYDVPLSHEPYGWLFVTDVWRQFSNWMSGVKPPGGRLRATLITHHGIAGILVKNHSPMATAN